MASRRVPRGHGPDLLCRPPSGAGPADRGWAELVVDPVEQLRELADLCQRGLLSPEEYEQQKAKVLDQ
jgi:hypothetical protein